MKVTPGVTRTPIIVGGSPEAVRVDRFHYVPGAHTHWHVHTGEQVLYGETGRGWVQFEGRPRDLLTPGDVVYVPIGHKHWHGAVPSEELTHLAMTAGGGTEWLEEVTGVEYAGDAGTAPVSRPDPDALVRRFITALENKDLDAALALVTDDVVYDNVPIGPVVGPDGIRAALNNAIGNAHSIHWVIRQQVASGDVVMNERLDRFTIDGREVEVAVAGLFVLREGRIALWRDYFDLASYRRQQGRG